MFSKNAKKNQLGALAQETQPRRGSSLFAPGLNPTPSHFNFTPVGQVSTPHFEIPPMTDVPAPPPLHWEPQSHEPAPIQGMAAAPIETPLPEVLPAWQPEAVAPSYLPPLETPPSLETSFDEPPLESLPPLPTEMYQPVAAPLSSPSVAPGIPSPAETMEESLAWGPLPPLENPTPVEEMSFSTPAADTLPASQESETDSWAAWTPAETGETSTLDPAAFLDTVNDQLYPSDPLGDALMDPMAAVEGAQAFEEAAPFLFSETVTASLDWQDETQPVDMTAPQMDFFPERLPAEPLELGPSYQPAPGDLDDLSALITENSGDMELSTFMEASASDFDMPDFGLSPLAETTNDFAAYETGDEGSDMPMSAELSQVFADAAEFSAAHGMEDLEDLTDALAMSFEENAPLETAAWETPTEPVVPPMDYTPPESVTEDWEDGGTWSSDGNAPAFSSNLEVLQESSPQEISLNDEQLPEPIDHATLAPPPENSLAAFLSEDDDFYASSFTLSEQGDVIPSYDANVAPPLEMALEVEETPPVMFEIPSEIPEPAKQTWPEQAEVDMDYPPITPVAPVSEPTLATNPPRTEPTTAEELWDAPPPSVAAAASNAETPAISFENLEILGVCQLTPDKRLLLVQSQDNVALMGQAGLDNPKIYVLKLFDHNPIAYQNTFAAAQEGQAGAQGMYVTQVGTWHAIVSTFQDQIVLHTELG